MIDLIGSALQVALHKKIRTTFSLKISFHFLNTSATGLTQELVALLEAD